MPAVPASRRLEPSTKLWKHHRSRINAISENISLCQCVRVSKEDGAKGRKSNFKN
jgi:hypothetical protein